MKKKLLLLLFFYSILLTAQQQNIPSSVNPNPFEESTSITITVNGADVNEAAWGIIDNSLYLWTWSFDTNDMNILDCPTNGNWTFSNEANKFVYNSISDTYTKTFTPSTFYNRSGIGRIGFLIKAKDGTNDKKSQDNLVEVGTFQVTLSSPLEKSIVLINSGASITIAATNTGGNANYNLKSNGSTINSNAATAIYIFTPTNITSNQNYELEITQAATTTIKKFSVIVNSVPESAALPAGLVDGINYNASDAAKATLVLEAPLKDFVYVAGSFNSWLPGANYAMKKDPISGKFWLELSGLTSGLNYTYQYWVVDASPFANSPSVVKTADPYSTLVLSPFDDSGISATSYPNLPLYPVGQEREVTVLQTGQVPYAWSSATTNFVKPEKENLVVYELLVRDFDAARSYQSIIDRIDYFKNLKINAIELMPVMEFENNDSWGYNTSFHLALDKFYGTSSKFKELVDVCHQNGIAVILDVALNHAFGRNPMVRMWMNDADGDGWGAPSVENPYFNTTAKHSYSVGEDFNHQSPLTQNYVKRVIQHWIQEYKIDGFRWDLTKGFTQNCEASDENCTNGYQQDRVDVLKQYADYSWSLDPNHYVIFEHLGNNDEEKQWANYKIEETPSKGIMMWGKMTDSYNELSMGYPANISGMTSASRGFTAKRLIGYAESHDEERLVYKNIQFGNSNNTAHDVKNLEVSLSRMSAIGAVSLLVPGPKMIWQFGELGWDSSIFSCSDGSVNTTTDAAAGDCKLATKPQPQWTSNWLGNNSRNKIYTDWSKMITMKTTEPVFLGAETMTSGSSLLQTIKISNPALSNSQLKDVLVFANFSVNTASVPTGFPYSGTWYNLMDNSPILITDVSNPMTIEAGGFRIYGNKVAALAIANYEDISNIQLYPNPASDYFKLDIATSKVEIYSISGKLVSSFDKNQEVGFQFSVNNLENGLYLIKVNGQNKEQKVFKLFKN
ncbi:alpha-amylase family glycosyl hydrolase [Flavobacterium weaverense]|uniref:Putative secreted protein (Por secretion system target) n=1 Tax=Flavobacterium weaverense TaxID=271156 RepID=A0A3L9ZZ33_9FLAO|nr:alpha-amylase family glycosyl hydrolase [Flavobacterium weaverense]RMA77740.1 putative secreted protein (Por secretion system target) [Flavobacterium weaverense]